MMDKNEAVRRVMNSIPLEERMKLVYQPIILLNCVCNICEFVLDSLAQNKVQCTKKGARVLRDAISGYKRDNLGAMGADLFEQVEKFSEEFFQGMQKDFFIHQLQYNRFVMNYNTNMTSEEEQWTSYLYVAKRLTQLMLKMDRDFSAKINRLLDRRVTYSTEEYGRAKKIIEGCNEIFMSFGLPTEVQSQLAEQSTLVILRKVEGIEVMQI